MFIAGVLLPPISSVVIIVGSLLASRLYATYKIYQHVEGFFKSKSITDAIYNLLPDTLSKQSGDIVNEINKYLSPSDTKNLLSVSRRKYSLFQPKRLLDIFLQRVAYGMQDKVEQLFTDIYPGDALKIQEALRYQVSVSKFL